jgi:hypothetical protein
VNFSANAVYADVLRESPSAAQVVTLLENLALEGRIMGAKVPCRRQSSRASADHSYFLATAAHDFNQRKAGDLMKGMSGCAPTDFYGRSHRDRSMRCVISVCLLRLTARRTPRALTVRENANFPSSVFKLVAPLGELLHLCVASCISTQCCFFCAHQALGCKFLQHIFLCDLSLYHFCLQR